MNRRTPQQNAPGNSQQGQQGQQGQRRNQSRDRNSYAPPGGYQGGNRDGGNAWANRGPTQGQPAALVEEHVPVRGFNSREVSEFLSRGTYINAGILESNHCGGCFFFGNSTGRYQTVERSRICMTT